MDNFLSELKRRHIYRVGAAYVVVAWALTQLVEILAQVFTLPLWIAQVAIVLLAIGFPVALLVAWTIESKPHQAVAAAVRSKPTIVDWTLCGALVVVIALVSYQQLGSSPGAAPAQQQPSAATAAAPRSPAQEAGTISIAVLPFANLSGDAGQEFFSDGMTEEITGALARVQSLRMVGRSSAFQFKGQNRDLRAIGQALGARYLIDGSVRKEGNRVRISAQLVQADNGVSVWTDSYDRELTSVFTTQEDIAQAIVRALSVPLGLQQGEFLVSNRTNDVESYQQYLRARALYRARAISAALAVLEPVVARDPNFAPAWALLARINILSPIFILRPIFAGGRGAGTVEESRRIVQAAGSKAEMAAREAIRLDPRLADGYGALAGLQRSRGNWSEAHDLYKQAMALDANEPDNLSTYATLLANVGRLKESLPLREQLRNLEPFVPVYNIFTGLIMQAAGQRPAAILVLEAVPPDPVMGVSRNTYLAQAYAADGRYAEAADTLLATKGENQEIRGALENAARLLRQAPAMVDAPQTLPVLERDLDFVYAHLGALDRILDNSERSLESGFIGIGEIRLWLPEYAPLRKTDRFKAYMRKVGLVDYWRSRGWPDLCRPIGADDFVCD